MQATLDPPVTTGLNPAQLHVLRGLMAVGEERPAYDPAVAVRLHDLLSDGLAPAAAHLRGADPDRHVTVFKHALTNIHQCERMAMAERQHGFTWSPSSARGTVAHKAI